MLVPTTRECTLGFYKTKASLRRPSRCCFQEVRSNPSQCPALYGKVRGDFPKSKSTALEGGLLFMYNASAGTPHSLLTPKPARLPSSSWDFEDIFISLQEREKQSDSWQESKAPSNKPPKFCLEC